MSTNPVRDKLVAEIAHFLCEWENSGELYTPAAERIVDLILVHEFIGQGLAERQHSGPQLDAPIMRRS